MSTLLVGLPQGAELFVILAVVLLLFGARKLPELARSLGASAKEFRKGMAEGAEDADMNGQNSSTDS
jgi:sec-independent protein translocase protein TatA